MRGFVEAGEIIMTSFGMLGLLVVVCGFHYTQMLKLQIVVLLEMRQTLEEEQFIVVTHVLLRIVYSSTILLLILVEGLVFQKTV